MNFLNNIKMKHKLILLLLIPCLVLIFFAFKSLLDDYANFNFERSEQMSSSAHLIRAWDDVVDALEEELITTTLFMENQGETSQTVSEARDATDHSIEVFRDTFSQVGDQIDEKLHKIVSKKIFEKLDLLSQKRGQLDGASPNALQDFRRYVEEFNAESSSNFAQASATFPSQQLSQELLAYIFLKEERIAAELEREWGIIALSQNQFNPELLKQFMTALATQENYHTAFTYLASQEAQELYKNLIKGTFIADINRIRASLLEKNLSGNFGINPQSWSNAQKEKINKIKEVKEKMLEHIFQEGKKRAESERFNLFFTIALILLVFIFTFIISRFIVKNITDSLQSSVKLAKEVSEGNLQVQTSGNIRYDELGDLEQALSRMIENLKTLNRKLQEEVDVLAISTSEIVTSVTQVSAGTSETATAVTETTTTVEELRQTAHVSAEKAKDVSSSAEKALGTLQLSENSLESTIHDMNQIQERMTTISESIVKLSEHSQAIGKIIDTVNDLAEQSNLLAVNAAIEAAKAGDQGKGFAVVAQEVRSLAEQSKQATVQVHTILNDIQNATSSAVMATEQGTKAVQKGVQQSSETNDSLRNLAQDIEQVHQAANQITISSQQQLIGVDQVNIAMNNIKEASNQHVDHMHQIKTAVNDLNKVGQSLKSLVDQYKT
jgi:methyl-accepting chemotaxis protein